MDFFNIGTAFRTMAEQFVQHSRATGRTTRMIDSLRDGDMVVCINHNQAKTVDQLCRNRGVNVMTKAADPKNPWAYLRGLKTQGKAVLDHVFVEEYYRIAIERAGKELDEIEKRLSTPKVAPIVIEVVPFEMHPGIRRCFVNKF